MNTHRWHSGPETQEHAPADVAVSCHRRLRGPYTGTGNLMRALVPGVYERRPELVREHAIEILSVAPELRDHIGAARETLTSLAVPEEQTRLYPVVRTRRIAHGLVEFLHSYAALSGPGPLSLSFTDADEADHTDQEFLAILIRRTQDSPVSVSVSTRGARPAEVLATALARYARPAPPAAPPASDAATASDAASDAAGGPSRDPEQLLRAYVDADGTSADPRERAAYLDADPRTRAALHDERAAHLLHHGDRSHRLGAVPYHLTHGADPAKAGGGALLDAVYYCAGMGFWHSLLDYVPRARAVVDRDAQAESYWDFTGKMSTALALLGRSTEAESLYVEVRGHYAVPMAQIFTGYALAMLYTRIHPQPLRDHRLAKAYLSNTITIASLLPDPAQRSFHTVFQQNGLALVEMHLGDLPEAHRLVTAGLERLDAELPADRHQLHRSVLVHNRARVNVALGWLRDALDDFTTVIRLDPNYPDYYFDRADLLQRMGDTAAALADYDTAITLTPPFWELHFNRADLRAWLGDTAGAVADLARVIELEPDQLDARVNLTGLLLETGEPDGVAELLLEGLRLHPGDARLLHIRGLLALESGHPDQARRDFDQALEADPGCVPALACRAALAFDAGSPDAAVRDLDRAVEAAPGNPDLRYNRGYAHQAAGRWAAAVEDYTRALDLTGTDGPDGGGTVTGELLRLRSQCHRELGDPAAARADEDAAALAVAGPAERAGAA